MTLRATGQVLGVLGVCATITVCTLYVTKSTAQSTKEGQPQAESNASPIYGITIPGGYREWHLISVNHSEENNKVLAIGFPGAGLQSSVAGSATNVQFMVKDSKKYAATGGWGFADFKDGKPGDEALHKTCFPCHQPAKAQDYVFTHYARTP